MTNAVFVITVLTFVFTMLLIYWRPKGLNEAIPSTIGAVIIILCGGVTSANLIDIGTKISGATLTIISTLVMALVLESIGFFHWVAANLANRAKGSGVRLFWYTNLLCFLMTLFFNNDGSIMITTPILLMILDKFKLRMHEKIPYLISGALIATAASAPIGVSNIVNLIALEIIKMDLYMQTAIMFVPAILGLLFLLGMLFLVFYKNIPKKLPPLLPLQQSKKFSRHPLQQKETTEEQTDVQPFVVQPQIMKKILIFVFLVRLSLFAASYFGVPVEIAAITGSIILLGWRWYFLKIQPYDLIAKAPWHILLFAFGMYIIIYGLNNIGLTDYLVQALKPIITDDLLHATLLSGSAVSILSNIFNNHPALMIGTLTITQMGLDPVTLKTVYVANIIGSDIGALLLPVGTLATLIWMDILKKNNHKIGWATYMKVTFIVIPPTVIFTLLALYYWISLVFSGDI